MSHRRLVFSLVVLLALCLAPTANAGFIRHLGHKIKGGSHEVATTTTHTGQAAVNGVQSAEKATTNAVVAGGTATTHGAVSGANAVKHEAVSVGKGAEEAPDAAVKETKKVWNAIW